MTVIRPNSISGITSLTAHRGSIDFYAHDGSAATFNNINSNVTSGVSTFASLNITGDLDVGGALTYEDVTNVDSIGVVTARNGIDVTGGTVTITTGANSASPASSGDNLVIKDSNGCGLSILSGNGNSQNIYLGSVSDNDCVRLEGFYNSGSPYFNIYTANTERLRIDSSGNIGIDCTPNDHNNFTRALDVNGPSGAAVYMRTNDSTSNCFIVGNYGSEAYLNNIANGNIRFYTQGTERFRLTSAGKIGLDGMTNPVAKLHIGTEDDAALTAQTLFVEGAKTGYANYTGLPQNQLCVYDNTASTAGSGGAIGFGANCGGSQQTWIAAIESQRDSGTNDASNYAGSIVFWTRPAQSTPTEKLRITSAGDVGIGTAVPVTSSGYANLSLAKTNGGQLELKKVSSGRTHYIWGDDNLNIGAAYNGSGSGAFIVNVNGNNEKLRIKSGGEITSGNISINAFANQNTPTGYAQFQFDNHYNTLFAQNLKLGASGGSGNHQIQIINQHSTIGGAGMYIGGNGSNQQGAINFYAETANQSPGTNVTSNRRAQVNSSSFFTWVEPRNQSDNAQSYLRTFGFTFNLQDGETETIFYNPDGYRRIYYEIYIQSAHGSNGYGYILANISRYGMLVHDEDWHVSHTSYSFSGSVGGNVNRNGIKFTRSGYSNTNITYYVIVKAFSPAGGNPYSNSGLTDPSYRYFNTGF